MIEITLHQILIILTFIARILPCSVEGIRQKSTAHDDSLHLLVWFSASCTVSWLLQAFILSYWKCCNQNRGQEDIRATLDVGLKSINEQLSKVAQQENLQQILSEVSSLPERVDTSTQKRNEELYKCLSRDLRACLLFPWESVIFMWAGSLSFSHPNSFQYYLEGNFTLPCVADKCDFHLAFSWAGNYLQP